MKSRFPLINVIVSLKQGKSRSVLPLYFLIVFTCLFIIAKSFYQPARNVGLNQFHFKNSFWTWSAIQVVPAMYNYANEFILSSESLHGKNLNNVKDLDDIHFYFWTNHYPLRILTFTTGRHWFLKNTHVNHVALRSRYQDQTLVSHFVLKHKDKEMWIYPDE